MKFTPLFIFSFLAVTSAAQQKSKIENASVGKYNITVYLPSGHDKQKEYRTLYFNDGQTLFGPEWMSVDKSADELIEKGLIDPVIIVGIHSDKKNRTSNYVPYADESISARLGQFNPSAAYYTKKIIQEIMPFVREHYGSGSINGIAGYSFGGLHATWAALHYADVFSFSGSLSPSYWVADFKIFKDAYRAKKSQVFYFDIGTNEWNYNVPFILHSKLPLQQSVFYYEHFGGLHILDDWRGQRTENILLLFAGKTDFSKYDWDIQLEFIRSETSGKVYPRINPVIKYSNGLTCSLSYGATYILLNEQDGVINKDGSFQFSGANDLKVKVIYSGQEKLITIPYNLMPYEK